MGRTSRTAIKAGAVIGLLLVLSGCRSFVFADPTETGMTYSPVTTMVLPAGTASLHVVAACDQNPRPGSDVAFAVWDANGGGWVGGMACSGTTPNLGRVPVAGWSNDTRLQFSYGPDIAFTGPPPIALATAAAVLPDVSIRMNVDAYDASGTFIAHMV